MVLDISDGIVRLSVHAGLHLSGAAGEQNRQTVALMRIGLGVLVDVNAAGVIEQIAIAFGDGPHPLQQKDRWSFRVGLGTVMK